MCDPIHWTVTPTSEWKTYKGEFPFLALGSLTQKPRLRTSPTLHKLEHTHFELPSSSYRLASLNVGDVVEGIIKYYEQPNTDMHYHVFFKRVMEKFGIDMKSTLFAHYVMSTMHSYLPGFANSYHELSNQEVLHDMTHDPSGELRAETSCGYGFSKRRKELARTQQKDIYEYLDTFDCSHDVLFTLFLKEEMREIGKATRSIAVPQVYLWLIFRKYFGWMYRYFERNKSVVAYAHVPNEGFFTELLVDFDLDENVISMDFKKQDSRMNCLFIEFLEDFILRTTNFPAAHEDKLMWVHNNSFYFKKVIDPYGNIVTFSNGEMSGFPGTLVYNSLYSLFLLSISQVVQNLTEEQFSLERFPIAILGDDVLYQHLDKDVVGKVADLLGHELYVEEGPLIDGVTFLSYKFHDCHGVLQPYYCNLDKMFGSLRYAKSDVTYFQKMASFHSLLTYAPPGSPEDKWRAILQDCLEYLLKTEPHKYSLVSSAYKHTDVWKKSRCLYNPWLLDEKLDFEFI